MVHSSTVSFFKVGTLLVLICCITCSTGRTTVSLEDRFQKLETKIYQLEEKNIRLEEKVTELEAKNAQLQIKIQQQQTILISLLVQANKSEPAATGTKSVSNSRQTVIQLNEKISGTSRTCLDLRSDDPSLSSGMHWIDPDGPSVGDSPIYVYCDMTSGSTSILHDSEFPIDVGHCADPGCYSLSVNYKASIKQIKALAELSTECHQSIRYDCFHAPFESGNIAYSWWNDRNGKAQYFWAGDNKGGIHTCQCGIDGNCVDSAAVKCNCDTLSPDDLADEGIITDKNVLPISKLNFGQTQMSSGIHTLGRFRCTGRVAVTEFPTSCKDLWLIGHILNGVYSVVESAVMKYVYCNFTKLPGDEGFEKWIGNAYNKPAPVHFYVQRNYNFNIASTPIPFDIARLNVGNAMNLPTGKFTAPRAGIYFFSFTGVASFPISTTRVNLGVGLYLNRNKIGEGHVDEANTIETQHSPLTLQSTLNLKKGDQVWVQIDGRTPEAYLIEGSHWTHFTGSLLDEEVVESL